MHTYSRPRSFTFGGSGGISSAAGVWTEPMVHRPVDSAWTATCVTDDRASGATTAASVPGARPARRDVPQGADGPSHPHGVRRTVAGCASCRHSHRIGEVTNSCARWTLVASLLQGRGSSEDGLPGCPTRRAMEAQTARGLLHPQDLGQGRVATEAAGLTQRWTAISRESSQEGCTPDEQGQPHQ